jgi:hypothetical protein
MHITFINKVHRIIECFPEILQLLLYDSILRYRDPANRGGSGSSGLLWGFYAQGLNKSAKAVPRLARSFADISPHTGFEKYTHN